MIQPFPIGAVVACIGQAFETASAWPSLDTQQKPGANESLPKGELRSSQQRSARFCQLARRFPDCWRHAGAANRRFAWHRSPHEGVPG